MRNSSIREFGADMRCAHGWLCSNSGGAGPNANTGVAEPLYSHHQHRQTVKPHKPMPNSTSFPTVAPSCRARSARIFARARISMRATLAMPKIESADAQALDIRLSSAPHIPGRDVTIRDEFIGIWSETWRALKRTLFYLNPLT